MGILFMEADKKQKLWSNHIFQRMRAAPGKVGQVKHYEHWAASFVLIIIKLFIVTIVTIVVIVTIITINVKDPGSRVAPSVPGTVLARSLNNKFSKQKMFCLLQWSLGLDF